MLCINVEKLYALQGDLSDTDMAKKLGVSRSQLWRLKTKKCSVGNEFISKFKKCFPEESMDDIFFVESVPLK